MNSTIELSRADIQPALGEVAAAELGAVTGGYDDGNWCGTPWRHGPPIPWPQVSKLLDKVSPVVVTGATLMR